jgi:sugar lactone lactonase YvrE
MTDHTLLADLQFPESARWRDGRLWLADWMAGRVLAVDPATGAAETKLELRALPLCFDWLPDGRLLVVDGTERRLLRQEPDGTLTTVADLRAVQDSPWNEIAVDARGNAFVNSIGFEFPGGEFRPGVVAVVTPDGQVRRVAEDVAFPNGMVVTAAGELVVGESYGSCLTAFTIEPDGGLTGRRTLARLEGSAPDGLCVDGDAVWFAEVPGRRCVRVTADGAVDRVVEAEDGCFSCVVGDGTLFALTAQYGPRGIAPGTGKVLAISL